MASVICLHVVEMCTVVVEMCTVVVEMCTVHLRCVQFTYQAVDCGSAASW